MDARQELRPAILGDMLLAEQAGMCRAWRNMDRRCGASLAGSTDQAVRSEYLRLRDSMAAMLDAEASAGAGSQLRLHHPVVARMLANQKVTFFSEAELMAAGWRPSTQGPDGTLWHEATSTPSSNDGTD